MSQFIFIYNTFWYILASAFFEGEDFGFLNFEIIDLKDLEIGFSKSLLNYLKTFFSMDFDF